RPSGMAQGDHDGGQYHDRYRGEVSGAIQASWRSIFMARSPRLLTCAVFLLPLLLGVPPMGHAGEIDIPLIKESQQHYQAARDALGRGDLQTGRDEMEISVEKAKDGNMPPAGLADLY